MSLKIHLLTHFVNVYKVHLLVTERNLLSLNSALPIPNARKTDHHPPVPEGLWLVSGLLAMETTGGPGSLAVPCQKKSLQKHIIKEDGSKKQCRLLMGSRY